MMLLPLYFWIPGLCIGALGSCTFADMRGLKRNWARASRYVNSAKTVDDRMVDSRTHPSMRERGWRHHRCGDGRARALEPSHLYRGDLFPLSAPIVPSSRHRSSLTISVVERLVEQGLDSLLIRVLQANAPARRFYEALGGQLVLEEQIEEHGAVLDQVAYGWSDVSALLHSR